MTSEVKADDQEVETAEQMREDLRPWFNPIVELVESHPAGLDWTEYFGNQNPVELDVGCGRGLFVHSASRRNPDRNYVGIEIDYKEARRAARRLKKIESPNGRFWGGDANEAYTKLIAPGSVEAIHVYFPDPWWKARHRRRRIFNDLFLAGCSRLLKVGGHLHSWTDVEEYFGGIESLMDNHPDFKKLLAPEERIPQHDMDYQTSFERKKRQLGLPIYRGLWQKVK
ncbi:MAG: tRNA (guanosine(46)-N7)-methyltransferase TrmB [Planctomycetota bacterium]|nr:MAG: tRNA (guanosine(46)-N7)-methyltransferase TrmB [Planctomycetota bacterium]